MYIKFGPMIVTVAVPAESSRQSDAKIAPENTSSLFLRRWSTPPYRHSVYVDNTTLK